MKKQQLMTSSLTQVNRETQIRSFTFGRGLHAQRLLNLTTPIVRHLTSTKKVSTFLKADLTPPRFVLRRLGISAQEFEDKIQQEIDDLFQEIKDERRQALLENLSYERVLSKADCRQMFTTPPTNSLLGVYRWAHDLSDDDSPSIDDPSSSQAPHHNA